MLDYEMIRTFITVAECKSFSRAAKVLHRTSAAISYRIKLLEENVGVLLFNRSTRSIELTPAGEYLFTRYQQLKDWVDTIPEELQQVCSGVEQNVNIVINNLLYDSTAVANLLVSLSAKFPFTHFHISRHVYMGVWDAMISEDYHFAIGVTGVESLVNDISVHFLGDINWIFVVSPHHPLASVDGVLREDQLRPYPAINVDDTAHHLPKRTAWLLTRQHEIKVPDLHTKLECHLNGVGVGFLPKNLCQPYIDSGRLIPKKVYRARHGSPLSLAWNESRKGPVVDYLINLFKSENPAVKYFLNAVS
ncbi:HTH-type transcriptional activator AllS [Entomomonas moraniae]|uniref:HTH-type transcriptional activator AllS n=1 Tax=Entomomonas moraniae TaxID=2213226 RepID=A0A3S9XG98_9GAMM|nr:HTH-type transcriptional activator AllS [Entomomonas moraniae]AZS51455.1 HTH-type transcriptional activator AllS [Entomomonas moraniae]